MRKLFGGDAAAPVKTEAPTVDPKKEFEALVKQLETTGIPNIAIYAAKFKEQFFDLATKAGLTRDEAMIQYDKALEKFKQNQKGLAQTSPEALAKPPELKPPMIQ